MTTKIINTEVYEWTKVPTTTKSGRTINKSVRVSTREEQECAEVFTEFKGKDYTFYVPVAEIKKYEEADYDDRYFFRIVRLYHADGERVMGVWQHGRQGQKRYTEPVLYDLKSAQVISVADYMYGQFKDNNKYLLKIN